MGLLFSPLLNVWVTYITVTFFLIDKYFFVSKSKFVIHQNNLIWLVWFSRYYQLISIDVCHFQVWWLLFPDWTQWVHKLTFPWWPDLATTQHTHLYGRVWNETLEDLSILSVWIDSDTTYTVQNNHRCAHTHKTYTIDATTQMHNRIIHKLKRED